ncbi:hypothetical protein Tco_1309638 [Tanacetum coccineum]
MGRFRTARVEIDVWKIKRDRGIEFGDLLILALQSDDGYCRFSPCGTNGKGGGMASDINNRYMSVTGQVLL